MIPERCSPRARRVAAARRPVRRGRSLACTWSGGIVRDLLLGREVRTRLRPHHRRAPARDQGLLSPGCRRRGVDQGERFGTIGAKRGDRTFEITTHRAEAYDPDVPQARREFSDAVEADLSRRDFTINAMALSLPDPRARRPLRRVRPTWPQACCARRSRPRSRSPTTRCACCGPPASSPATASPPTSRAGRGGQSHAPPARDRLGRAHPRRARQADGGRRPVGGLWFLVDTGLADEFLPELPPCASSRTPSTATRTCSPTPSRWWRRPPRAADWCASPRCCHDIGKPRPATSEGQGGDVPPPRGGRRPHGPQADAALRYPTTRSSRRDALVFLHLRFHTYGDGVDRLGRAPLRARRRPLLDELNELTRCDCTTRNQRKARCAGSGAWTSSRPHRRAARAEELDAIRPDLDGKQVMEHLGVPPGPVSARPWMPARAAPGGGPARRGGDRLTAALRRPACGRAARARPGPWRPCPPRAAARAWRPPGSSPG
jgi:poly(A) polymerase